MSTKWLCIPLWAGLASGPAQGSGAAAEPDAGTNSSGAAGVSATGPAKAYTVDEANRDIDMILSDRGSGYLRARARLEDNAEPASRALRLRLAPPMAAPQRHRLLNVLGGFGQPEDLPLFAEALVQATAGSAPERAPERQLLAGVGDARRTLMEPWRSLILAHGRAATPTLVELVNDRRLSTDVRGELLAHLVDLLTPQELPGLVDTLGRGDPELGGHLRRALALRARARPGDVAGLVTAISHAFGTAPEPLRAAALLSAWGAVAGTEDVEFGQMLARLSLDAETPFAVRVAAIRLLPARRTLSEARNALSTLARTELAPDRRVHQASELLGWLALEGLDDVAAREIADTYQLWHAEAPRLAELGFRRGTLPRDNQWLALGLENPWPQVRRAALHRVVSPCAPATLEQLSSVATGASESDLAVSRASLEALGSCGDAKARAIIEGILDDPEADLTLRATAGGALILSDPTHGPAALAARLQPQEQSELVDLWVEALTRAPQLSESVHGALCNALRDHPRAAATILRALSERFSNRSCPAL